MEQQYLFIQRRRRAIKEQYKLLLIALRKGKTVHSYGNYANDLVVKMKEFFNVDIELTKLDDIDPTGITGLPIMSKEAHEKQVAKLNSIPKYIIKLK